MLRRAQQPSKGCKSLMRPESRWGSKASGKVVNREVKTEELRSTHEYKKRKKQSWVKPDCVNCTDPSSSLRINQEKTDYEDIRLDE